MAIPLAMGLAGSHESTRTCEAASGDYRPTLNAFQHRLLSQRVYTPAVVTSLTGIPPRTQHLPGGL